MKPLALLGLALALTTCGPNTTALDPVDGGANGTGGAGEGGFGGAGRGRPDGSIEDSGGSGGSTGGTTGGSGGATGGSGGGTGGSTVPDAGPPDAKPDAGDLCQTCAAYAVEYGDAIRKEQACNPLVASQCAKQTPGQLNCGCPVWVTTTVLSDDVRQRYIAAGCQKCQRLIACPAIACAKPGMGVCTPVAAAQDPVSPIVAPPPKGQCMSKF